MAAKPHTQPLYFLKWTRDSVQRAIGVGQVISLYVANVTETWKPADIYRIMSKYGEVIDVYIPSKRSRSGRRFCFVRYRGLRDIQRLLNDVGRVQVEHGFIRANVAKGRNRTQPLLGKPFRRNLRTAEKSYASALQEQERVVDAKTPAPTTMEAKFIPTTDTLSWLARCMIGTLKDPCKMDSMSLIWRLHGVEEVQISKLGGDRIIVCFPTIERMSQFLGSVPDWVPLWFQSLVPWHQGLRATNRRCWLTLRGVPLNAWCHEFFVMVGSFFGRLLRVDTDTAERRFLGDVYVQVLTEIGGTIRCTLEVTVAGQKYVIELVESCFTAVKTKTLLGEYFDFDGESDQKPPPSEGGDGAEERVIPPANQASYPVGSQGDLFGLMPIIMKHGSGAKSKADLVEGTLARKGFNANVMSGIGDGVLILNQVPCSAGQQSAMADRCVANPNL
ncbi:hypothetical protein Tsubulata_045590 [Turnera subulata]|uniref:RRM domain-containing protein n=1 Tax=Turnera subulata TaxID=218843 RepID=A0A9Q0GIX2_9ROSI|nr:hypothetical protein Tsubulata_045590 [Turnera subulata]